MTTQPQPPPDATIRRTLSDDDIRELAGEQGCSVVELAVYCRCAVWTISGRMKRLGVTQRPRMWKWAG